MSAAADNALGNLQESVNRLIDVYAGHDHVHPDRDECGGVGGCLMMRAECDGEDEVERILRWLAKHGIRMAIDRKATS